MNIFRWTTAKGRGYAWRWKNARTWGRPAKREESTEKWRAAFAFISHLSHLKWSETLNKVRIKNFVKMGIQWYQKKVFEIAVDQSLTVMRFGITSTFHRTNAVITYFTFIQAGRTLSCSTHHLRQFHLRVKSTRQVNVPGEYFSVTERLWSY